MLMLYMLECRIEEREEKEIAESNKSQYTASPHYAFCGIVIDLYIDFALHRFRTKYQQCGKNSSLPSKICHTDE
jgi:hypothetical protein